MARSQWRAVTEWANMQLGRVGIWTTALDHQPAAEARRAAAELEEMGFGAIWIGEAVRREAFSNATLLLTATRHIVWPPASPTSTPGNRPPWPPVRRPLPKPFRTGFCSE